MPLALRLPPLTEHSPQAPETRPSRVAAWLADVVNRDPALAARVIGEALAVTNRIPMGHSRRLDVSEQYWKAAALLWPRLEHQFVVAAHPLTGENLEAAKAALMLANELAIAYKRLLAREAAQALRVGRAAPDRCADPAHVPGDAARADQQLPVVRAGACAHAGPTPTTSTCSRASAGSTATR